MAHSENVCFLFRVCYSYTHIREVGTVCSIKKLLGRGGGQVISELAFYSDDPSSNPIEVYSFSVILCLKRTKINEKETGVGPLFKKYCSDECDPIG